MRTLFLTSLLAVSAFSADTHADGNAPKPSGMAFTIAITVGGEPGQCEPSTKTTIAGEAEMYMIKGKKTLSHKDGTRKTSFPLQEQFRGFGQGVVSKSRSTSLANDAIACEDMVVTWDVKQCINQNRDEVPCPRFKVVGAEALADFIIVRP
ncbi:MAG: hypothetical protein AAF221_14420 [Pseudomonadota bacterium]